MICRRGTRAAAWAGVVATAAVATLLAAAPLAAAATPSTNSALTVTYLGNSGSYSSTTTNAPCPDPDASPPDNADCFSGPFTNATQITGWTVPFAPITIDHAAGQFTSQAPVPSLLLAGTSSIQGTYVDDDAGAQSCQSSVPLTVDPSGPPATMSIAVAGAQSGVINVEPPPSLVVGSGGTPYNCTFSEPGGNPHYPDTFRASAQITAAMLQQARSDIPVDQSNPAAFALAPDCLSDEAGYDGVAGCSQTLQWSGDIELQPTCGTATVSDSHGHSGQRTLSPGDSYQAAAGGPSAMDFGDLSISIAPSSVVDVSRTCFSFQPGFVGPTITVGSGSVWGSVVTAACGIACIGIDAIRAAATSTGPGAHAAAVAPNTTFTLTVQSGGARVVHVISGAVVLTAAYGGGTVTAGTTELLRPRRAAALTTWPAAAQRLVPAGQRPPRLTAVRLTGRRVTFALNERARVRVALIRGRRTVASRTASARRGRDTVTLARTPPRGRLTLSVTATDRAGRVSLVRLTLG